MRRLSLLFLVITTFASAAATPEEQARAVLDGADAAFKAKDPDAIGALMAPDCVVIMTEPIGGAKRALFFTRDSYLKLLKERLAQLRASSTSHTIQTISASDSGDVFATMEAEDRSLIDKRSEWSRWHEYFVLRTYKDKMLIHLIVAEMSFYIADVPPAPEEPKR